MRILVIDERETWRSVPGYEGLYEVSNLGRVKALDKIAGQHRQAERIMKARSSRPRGRLQVNLSREGNKVRWYVHTLVLTAFRGPRPPGMQACHGDGDPNNNRSDNLRWDTPEANAADDVRHGKKRGERNGRAKLTEAAVGEIRALLRKGKRHPEIARRFGVSSQLISQINRGHIWRAP